MSFAGSELTDRRVVVDAPFVTSRVAEIATDTDLSRPFQANVPAGKLFGVDYAVARMLGVIDRLQPADSGQFFAWDGERIPW